MAPKPSSATSTNTAAAIRHRGTGFMLSLLVSAQRAAARKRGWWGRGFRLPTAQARIKSWQAKEPAPPMPRGPSYRRSRPKVFPLFHGGVGRMDLAVEGESAAFQRAVIDVQGDAGRRHMERAPGGGGAPEAAMSSRGVDHNCTLAAMVDRK